jgi:hypothetical protein
VSELGLYTARTALVSKTNIKGIRSEHIIFRLGFRVILYIKKRRETIFIFTELVRGSRTKK